MFLALMLLCAVILLQCVTVWLIASAIEREGKRIRLFMLMVSKSRLSDEETVKASLFFEKQCDQLLKSTVNKR